MRASSLASGGGGGIAYLARLRLAMDGQGSMGAGCFLDLVGFGLGAVAVGEGGVEGCCLGFEERERRMERERKRLNPVRLTGGSSDGMGGMGMSGYADL
jgi:hypothetical protein